MHLEIANIIDHIKPEWVLYQSIENHSQPIHGVKIYGGNDVMEKQHYLYVLSLENTESLYENIPPNLFVIQNNFHPVPIESIKNTFRTSENLVILAGVNMASLVNHISEMIADNYELIKRPAALFNTIIKGRGLPYILEVAGELLENPVLLGDNNHRLLAASNFGEIDDISWMEFRNVGYSTYEYTQKYGYDKWLEATSSMRKPIIGDLGKKGTYRRIFATIQNNKRIIGHIAVLEYNRPFTDRDLEVTEFICNVLASEMKDYYSEQISNMVVGRLMLDLLQGIDLTEIQINNRIRDMQIVLPKTMQLIAIRFNNYSDTFGIISYILEPQNNFKLLTDVVIFKHHLLFIMPSVDSEQTLKMLSALEKLLKKASIPCGISQPFSDIRQIKKYHLQSTQAIIIGEKNPKEKHLFHYEDYAMMALIYELSKSVDLNKYVHSSLLFLNAYDTKPTTLTVSTPILAT